MMGRIAAIDALETDYRTVLIGSASGGVFKSTNGGLTWTAIFDDYGSGSIGDVALCQDDPNIIWIGTGEAANRNSSGWGDGIYKSVDGGKTFEHMGLAETHHIAEIEIHPENPEIVWAASPGHLWGYSGDRGLFETRDGGATWRKLSRGLPDDAKIGCTDIEVDPRNPDVMYAAMYHRIRSPFSMYSGGENGGIYKSEDGGETWRKLGGGLPKGATGMIDVSIHARDCRVVVACVEADEAIEENSSEPGPGVYRSDDGGETWRYLLRHATRPFYHGQIAIDPMNRDRIYVVSREFAWTDDGGETWQRGKPWRGIGGDDHDLWISPQDNRIHYTATDQGAFLAFGDDVVQGFDNMAIGQYYAIATDMSDPYRILGGLQDNGLWLVTSNSRENRGILNRHATWLAEGDGFHCGIDPTDNRTAYTVNHCGFLARQNIETRRHAYITPTPETVVNFEDWVDREFPETPTQYTIEPGEHWFFGEAPERPRLPAQFRFNWSSPFLISTHDAKRLYFAGNHLFRSDDRGDTWRIVSPDLTTNDPEKRNPSEQGGLTRNVTGGENYCTIVTVAESALDPAELWVGTDDGHVQVTRNGGETWTNVGFRAPRVSEGTWVSRIEASGHEPGVAFVTFDNHRRDDFAAYVFRVENYGARWIDLTTGLPDDQPIYVIRQDPVNRDLLFVGSEFAIFMSLNGGESWSRFTPNLPTVAVHDLVIHPRDADLIAGTHGRSLWILDDITPLRQLTPEVRAKAVRLLEPRRATKWNRISTGRRQPALDFRGENPPRGARLAVWFGEVPDGDVGLRVEGPLGDRVRELELTPREGLVCVTWDFLFEPSEEDRQEMRARLRNALASIESRVIEDEIRERLAAIAVSLEEAQDADRLNAVRRTLVTEFNAFASGQPFFGKKLEPIPAEAGRYRVILTVGDEEHTTFLEVREDPLG